MKLKSILTAAISIVFTANIAAQSPTTMQTINANAPVKCTQSIVINASPEKIWQVLTAIDNWATWQTGIKNPKLNGALAANTTFDWKTGGAKIHSTIHTVVPYQNFGWSGKSMGMYAIHNWTFTNVDGATQVTVEESMEGFLAKLFKKSFNKQLKTDMQNWLTLLKAECEK